MKGINRAIQYTFAERYEQPRRKCIFLSHRSVDKENVKRIGEYIIKAGLDIYLDLNDKLLQQAQSVADAQLMTQCIHNGIAQSDHILCVVSNNTFNESSWWVPYEIGYADKSNCPCSVMPLASVTSVPEFMKIKPLISTIDELNSLIRRMARDSLFELKEQARRITGDEEIVKSSPLHELTGILR